MDIKVIKSAGDYEAALTEIEELVDLDPAPGTPAGEKIELLALVIENYEAKEFPSTLPDPIEAIRFRMEQAELNQRDLVPYLGSRSKVSEVLAGKRPLTLSMIRALHTGLGIPATVLLQDRDPALLEEEDVAWERFPLKEMVGRGWIEATAKEIRENAEELVRRFFAPLRGVVPVAAHYRQNEHIRSARGMDEYALHAWRARVLLKAKEMPPRGRYVPGSITPEVMRKVAQLSPSETGPLDARDFLSERGIAVVIEPHLAQTYLDGAAMLAPDGTPVIGLTIRYDRLDNFWYCLEHELAHVARHLNDEADQLFYDDLKVGDQGDSLEAQADALAEEALIPSEVWRNSPLTALHSPESVAHLAQEIRVHPSIVAGRMQFEANNYKILHQLVGRDEVRTYFPGIRWK